MPGGVGGAASRGAPLSRSMAGRDHPVRASTRGKYLELQNGEPFLLVADAGWEFMTEAPICLASRASPVHTEMRNCTRDEGGPFGIGDQVADPKPPRAAAAKSRGGERRGNVGTMIPAGEVERGERKRTN